MILQVILETDGEEWYVYVKTNNGGDKTLGPYWNETEESIVQTAKQFIEEAWDEEVNEKEFIINHLPEE